MRFRDCSTMRIDVLTGFPNVFTGPLSESIVRRATLRGAVEIVIHDLRDYAHDPHRSIDDSPYGGGAGMLLKPEPIFECLEALMIERTYDEIVLTTPAGTTFTQEIANTLSMKGNMAIICGHYKGVDERVRTALVTKEISIGDYVLTGGELATAVMIDAIVRLIPGVIGDAESLLSDSFMDGMLDCPYYTRPPEFRGMSVPPELLSGDHALIARWRKEQSQLLTESRRPDLIRRQNHPESTR